MAHTNNPQEASDRISPQLSKAMFEEIEEYSKHDNFRKRVKEIFADCIKDIDFVDTIKKYAKQQIEFSVYQNIGFWVKTTLIPMAVTVITAFIMKYFNIIK